MNSNRLDRKAKMKSQAKGKENVEDHQKVITDVGHSRLASGIKTGYQAY